MPQKIPEPTLRARERTLMVGMEIHDQEYLLSLDESLEELRLLADTAGLDIVGQTTQKLDRPNPQTLIGTGKIKEIQALVEELQVDVILFDEELSPRHQRELENIFEEKVRILDRTALILDIFAQHASTNEGVLQVELAQYEYRLPRLTRYWTHLARQAGGGGGRTGSVGGVGLRGPGETQLEVDRREIRRRIKHIKEQIEKVRIHRQQYRSRRKNSLIPVIALVGYTNAGKSTLLNQLSKADVYVADQLFATLDPTTRRVELPGGHVGLFTDTVGFIQKLPTTLVAAFRATLEEIAEADLLLHVVDITHPHVQAQTKAVYQTLKDIGASDIPILTALNKIDKLKEPDRAKLVLENFPNAVAISALKGEGISDLLRKVSSHLFDNYVPIKLNIPYQNSGLIALFHEQGKIDHEEHGIYEVKIEGRIPVRLLGHFRPFERKEQVGLDAHKTK